MVDDIGFGATIPESARTSGGTGRVDRAAGATAVASPEPASGRVGRRAV
ncbi:hypothetical protein ACRBEV_05375 [Methylobacterium phyllosphaerae]